jgi:hypothetical protein
MAARLKISSGVWSTESLHDGRAVVYQPFRLSILFLDACPGAALVWLRQTLLCPRLFEV